MQMRETRWRTTEMTMTQPVSVVLVLSRVKRVVQRLSGEVLLSRRRESRLRYHFDSHDISSVESPWSKLTWKFLIPCTWGRKEMLDSRKRLRLSMTWTSSAQHGLSHVYEWLTFHLQKRTMTSSSPFLPLVLCLERKFEEKAKPLFILSW